MPPAVFWLKYPLAAADRHRGLLTAILAAIHFSQANADVFTARGRQIFPDEIGTNRQFAVAPVHEYGKLNGRGATQVKHPSCPIRAP